MYPDTRVRFTCYNENYLSLDCYFVLLTFNRICRTVARTMELRPRRPALFTISRGAPNLFIGFTNSQGRN